MFISAQGLSLVAEKGGGGCSSPAEGHGLLSAVTCEAWAPAVWILGVLHELSCVVAGGI